MLPELSVHFSCELPLLVDRGRRPLHKSFDLLHPKNFICSSLSHILAWQDDEFEVKGGSEEWWASVSEASIVVGGPLNSDVQMDRMLAGGMKLLVCRSTDCWQHCWQHQRQDMRQLSAYLFCEL